MRQMSHKTQISVFAKLLVFYVDQLQAPLPGCGQHPTYITVLSGEGQETRKLTAFWADNTIPNLPIQCPGLLCYHSWWVCDTAKMSRWKESKLKYNQSYFMSIEIQDDQSDLLSETQSCI